MWENLIAKSGPCLMMLWTHLNYELSMHVYMANKPLSHM